MKRKLIFLDIDGTLTEPGANTPPASALEAIAKARAGGHKVLLCTGRSRGMFSSLLRYDWDGYIGSAGGYVVCDGELIFDCPMEPHQQEKVLNNLKRCGIYYTIECLDAAYTDEAFKNLLKEQAGEDGNSELLRWRQQIETSMNIHPMSAYEGQPCYKIVINIPDEADLVSLEEAISDEFQVIVQESRWASFRNGEIMNRRFDKGRALRRAAQYYGIPVEDTIAFGDSMNDLEMIETAGLGICMANGAQALQALADEVCPSVTDDGISQAFARLGLF